MSLSLCMIVKNEQENLVRCLESVKDIVDEMVIVDTGSTDSTVQIAESYGARVYPFEWNGNFSDARNYSLKYAASDWILLMDADDELDKSYHNEILELVRKDEADAYFFKTISYVGDSPGLDTLNNLNIRLLRNKKGYFFCNPIHEQIYSVIKAVNPSAQIVNVDIKVYHYGYLDKNIVNQNKRNRNISILEKELEQNPGYTFTLFNLGNEYFALGNFFKAIEYYEQSYGKFDPGQGFSSKLVLKMVNCYMNILKHDKALKLISEGLAFYGDFTELEYFRALIYLNQRKFTLALKHFDRCIKMGESPLFLSMIDGVGTYRAYFMLGEIHFSMEDYEAAAGHYKESLEYGKDFTPALLKLLMSYSRQKLGNQALKGHIDETEVYGRDPYDLKLYDILIEEKYYELALEYIRRDEKKHGPSADTKYYKGLCKLMLKKYQNAYKIMDSLKNDPGYGVKALCLQALCKILKDGVQPAYELLFTGRLPGDDRLLEVYRAFYTFLDKGEVVLLSDIEEESSAYCALIFDLLKILIALHEFETFEKALNLLNSINDKTVLLKLAKLYYAEGCYMLAYQEFTRSIKTFEVMDTEGAGMLHRLKTYGY